jgi:MoxR-like ATPase
MPFYFVGREEEQKEILKTLDEGWNVILTGKFGIGRTTLVKHIASLNEIQWRFVFIDFLKTPSNICRNFFKLFPISWINFLF